MKNIKLFLLAGVLSLIGIGSFTNAGSVSTTCNGVRSPCSNYDYTTTVYNNVYSCFNVPDNTDSVVLSSNGCSFFNYYYGGSSTYNEACNVDYTFTDKSFICVNGNQGVFTLTFNPKPLLPGGVDGSLTPVINGLSESINEFIPYVVYVGLGVLGALIGFFAIKRLVNRVKRQSFGVFSSRKRK